MPKRGRSSVALRYDDSMPAPVIVAKGTGLTADRIERIAADAGIPVVRDAGLAAGLEPIDIGGFVPSEYWELVARVLVFIRKVRR